MRRHQFSLAVLALLPPLVVVGACSSNQTPSSVDAGPGGKAIGATCNPSVPAPCESLSDVCSVSMCDPTTLRCVRVAVDAGPVCTGGIGPTSCASGDCDASAEAGDSAIDAPADAPGISDSAVDAGEPEASIDASFPDGEADVAIDAAAEASDAGGE